MAKAALPFRIIPTDEWGAVKPSGAIIRVGKPAGSIFHHTAGHASGDGKTYDAACAYARVIQHFHMVSNGWNDSGHNFLVTRGGFILEGRHGSVASIKLGLMVDSAHCPGKNGWPGVEHEHKGSEKMTPIQREASVWLHAWICEHCGIRPDVIAQPHKKYFSTSCPANLATDLPALRKDVAAELVKPDPNDGAWYDKFGPKTKPAWFFKALREYQRRLNG